MDESDSSGSNIEEVLLKSRQDVREGFLLKSKNNLPSSSSASIVLCLESGNSSKKGKRKIKKKQARKKAKNKTKTIDEVEETPSDLNPREHNERNYSRLSDKELANLANRVRIYHDTGIVLSEEEDTKPCKNRYKKKKKSSSATRQEQIPGTHYGKGQVGTSAVRFGVQRCACCNVLKESCCSLEQAVNSITMLTPITEKFKQREERRLYLQQLELLGHPELAHYDLDDESDQAVVVPELTTDKREWVQRFIDTMSPNRIDYEKIPQTDIVKGIAPTRLSDAKPISTETETANLVLQRVDFDKAKAARLKNVEPFTSTPILQSQKKNYDNENCGLDRLLHFANAASSNRLVTGASINKNVECLPSTSRNPRDSESPKGAFNFEHLDLSNITMRTHQSRSRRELGASTSKFKTDMSQMEETDLIRYVDMMLGAESDSINQQVNEQCDRIRERQNSMQHFIDDILVIDDTSIDHFASADDSIEIIDDIIPHNISDNSGIEVVAEFSPNNNSVVYISETNAPTTSRIMRKRRAAVPAANSDGRKKRKQVCKTAVIDLQQKKPEPTIIEAKQSSSGLRDCPVCLESMNGKELSSTTCGHVFCTSCIKAAIKTQRACPNCRTALSLKKIHPIFL